MCSVPSSKHRRCIMTTDSLWLVSIETSLISLNSNSSGKKSRFVLQTNIRIVPGIRKWGHSLFKHRHLLKFLIYSVFYKLLWSCKQTKCIQGQHALRFNHSQLDYGNLKFTILLKLISSCDCVQDYSNRPPEDYFKDFTLSSFGSDNQEEDSQH